MSSNAAAGRPLPTGVVTFLLTDVESSTRLWREESAAASVMARQAELIAISLARYGGARPLDQGEGDSMLAAFERASDALAAALEAQRALAAEPWPDGAAVRVRMAVHTGEAELRDAHNYGGTAIIRCARLRALARGAQVLVSSATAAIAGDRLPDGATLIELETLILEGFERPERVHQLCHPELPLRRAPLRASRASLLPWPTSMVGRERELRELADLLGRHRLVTVTGAGGSGKTRLAHAVAAEVSARAPARSPMIQSFGRKSAHTSQVRQDCFGDHWVSGVVWVELARLSAGVQVAGAVAGACGVPEAPGVASIDLLERYLARAEVLIVLDNCEHLLEDCARVTDIAMRAGSGVTVLATSREPLGVAGEVTWRIPSLALAPEEERDPERLASFDAVRLFVERAQAAQPDFHLDDASAASVADICRRLDGIPLAIELAAARVRAVSVARLADGLDDRFRLLTGGARTAMARQRTLLASVEWSHGLLDEQERVLFRRLGVFTSPFSLEATEAVASGDDLDRFVVLDVLARLVDKSLVQHSSDRYRLLETLRQYAVERAADAGELAPVRDRHLAWCRQRAAQWRLDREVATNDVLDEVAAEAPDLIAALEWSLGPHQKAAIDLLYPLAEHWFRGRTSDEVKSLAAKILGRYEEGSPEWLEALAPMAVSLFVTGDVTWLPAARRALDCIGGDLSPAVRGYIEQVTGWALTFAARSEGLAGLRRAIDDARAAGNRALECAATARLVAIVAQGGDPAGARPLLAWLDRHVPEDAWIRFLIDMAHAAVAAYNGDFEIARGYLDGYLDTHYAGAAWLVGHIGWWTDDADQVRQAITMIERNVVLGPFEGLAISLHVLPSLLAGDLDAARRQMEAGLGRDMSVTNIVWLRNGLVSIALSTGDLEAARAQIAAAEPIVAETFLHQAVASLDVLRAAVARADGEPASAEGHAHDALARALDHELGLVTVDALETLALLAADAGREAEAARLLGAIDAFRTRTGYKWRALHRRRAIDELRPHLEDAPLEEGRRLSLAEAAEYVRRGRGERGRPSRGWESLTPTEQRVVELVATGLPNREIAAKLFVSLATIKTHLVHVYGKLDVRTRAELAAAATRRGMFAESTSPAGALHKS